jgi:uncharacterized protein
MVISRADFLKEGAVEKKGEVFEGDVGFVCDAAVDYRAVKISDEKVYVKAKIKGSFTLECSRCLEKYKHPFEIKLDADMDFYNGAIDLGEEIRQLLLLEAPMKPLCRQDCLGICPVCGRHNKTGGVCSCADNVKEDFTKERWKELLTGGSKNAKSKKKTHASPQR